MLPTKEINITVRRKWVYSPFSVGEINVNISEHNIIITGENNTCILPYGKPVNPIIYFENMREMRRKLLEKENEILELEKKLKNVENLFNDFQRLYTPNHHDITRSYDLESEEFGCEKEISFEESKYHTTSSFFNSSCNSISELSEIDINDSEPFNDNCDDNDNDNDNENDIENEDGEKENIIIIQNNEDLLKEKLKLAKNLTIEECLQSVFQKGTTHYLNPSLIVQSFMVKNQDGNYLIHDLNPFPLDISKQCTNFAYQFPHFIFRSRKYPQFHNGINI